ncbi:MAG: hypothetical protein EXS37_20360 [Opitutus sp.]|nr:hypothetical protein [Opitutus sp.]
MIEERKFTLRQIAARVHDAFDYEYEYDFGDSWAHEVTVEKILPHAAVSSFAHCLDGARACPPEDCGGVCGYQGLLKILKIRKHPEHHIFAVDEFYGEDRPRYYAALDAVRRKGDDLTSWLEYFADGLRQTLERVREQMGPLSVSTAREKRVLRSRQEQLLKVLGKSGGMPPSELWAALKVSKQGAMDLMRPLLKAGLVKRVSTLKTARYVLN